MIFDFSLRVNELSAKVFGNFLQDLAFQAFQGSIFRVLVVKGFAVFKEQVGELIKDVDKITFINKMTEEYHLIDELIRGMTMTTREIFSKRMRELRKETGQPQKVLADLLGVSVNQVSEMEKGTRMTTLEKLPLICRHYNVSADYLLGLTDRREGP